jgi:hypothetical protein
MRDIYEAADEVIAWLGEENAQEATDIETLKRMAGSENESSRDENTLRPILNNPYFSRLWIVQELVLAKEIIVMIGNNEIAWDALILACSPHMLLCTEDDLDSPLRDSSSILDRLHAARVKEPDILSAVNAFCGQKCADPRDKLYGLYGLLGRPNRGHTWISYDSPVRQVFQRFCRDVLNPLNVNDFEFETLSRLSWEMGLGQKMTLEKRPAKDPIPPKRDGPFFAESENSNCETLLIQGATEISMLIVQVLTRSVILLYANRLRRVVIFVAPEFGKSVEVVGSRSCSGNPRSQIRPKQSREETKRKRAIKRLKP